MTRRAVTITVMLIALVFISSGSTAWALVLAEAGGARGVIVVASDAIEAEKHAAAELASFLGQIVGDKFEVHVVPGGSAAALPADVSWLLVGPDAARFAEPNFTTTGLGTDGIVLRTAGKDLIVAGGRPRGTLYAVYTLLEDYLGCRWWSSKVSRIPRRDTIEIRCLDVRYVPRFEYREPFWTDAFDGDWAVRNKCNGHAARLDAKRGGKYVYEGFVHTFYRLIPPAKYFKDHPEWFSLINGKRTYQRAQLCLTNEQMRAELVKNLKAALRRNPAARIASVSQNDWHGNCQCPRCAAIEKAEGSPAGLMLRFVNAVAEEIEQEFPRVAISTLAYQYTRKPPKLTRPRDNVIVRLCSIECSFSRPLADERNKAFRDDIVGWSKICDRLYIWDYTTNFRHHVMPHPNLRVLGPNIKFFADHNVKGIFEQGAYGTYGAEMAELRAWVLAKLLWDPSRDGAALIDEFLAGYYGPAGPYIKKYLEVTHNAVEAAGDWLGCFSPHTAKFLSFETLARAWSYLEAAEQAVRDDPDLLFRVEVAQLPVMYVFMMRWAEMRSAAEASGADWPMPEDIDDVYKRFVRIAEKKKITRLSEWREGYGPLQDALKKAKK